MEMVGVVHGGSDNPLWYRVCRLRPRLVAHADLQKQLFRGDTWYVLNNLASGRAYRFSQRFYRFIAMLDGKRTVEASWQVCNDALGEDALSQDDVMEVLARLYLADVLQTDQAGDAFELFERQRRQRQGQRLAQAKSPLSIRIPLFDPDSLLGQLAPIVAPLFSRVGLMLWTSLIVAGGVMAFINFDAIVAGERPQLLSADNLLILGLCYPCIKALHELGHGLATKVWGGEVHQAGILLMAFIPLPFIDATAANAFPEKSRRIVVSAVGIMVELTIAILALGLWLSVEPGLVRDVAYNLMLIGSVSTLFFNGNPLLRFDSYYILSDAIGIPNLGARSTKHLAYLVKRYAFGAANQKSIVTHPGEPPWLVSYGVLSYVYRIVIVLTIAMFIAEAFPSIGIALALWSITTAIVWPIIKHSGKLFIDPELERCRARALGVSASVLLAAGALVFVVPAPLATVAQGVVAPPRDAEIRTARAGILEQFVARPDTVVQAGDPLVKMVDPFLQMEVDRLEAKLREMKAERKTLQSERKQVEIAMVKEKIRVVVADLNLARDNIEALAIDSPTIGVFLTGHSGDAIGRFYDQGALVGYVADLANPTIRVVLPQADVGLVKSNTERVTIRLAERPLTVYSARITRQVPGAIAQLPSAALGARGGGPFAIDPQDESGTRPVESVFEFELAVPTEVTRLGGRVYVRFDHGSEPLGRQWYRRLRQLFLRRFNV